MPQDSDNPFIDAELLEIFEQIDKNPDIPPQTIPSTDLYTDIARVAHELGHVPRRVEYIEHGVYSTSAITTRFSYSGWGPTLRDLGFINDVQELGYKYKEPEGISESDARTDFERVRTTLGHIPNKHEYNEHGTYSHTTVLKYLGPSGYSWKALMKSVS